VQANGLIAFDSMEGVMSLHFNFIGDIPAETVRVARAAFPNGTVVTRLRDEFTQFVLR
jgi:transposase